MSAPTILVVDSDPRALQTMREALVNEGYAVITARSGGEALARLSEPPALVVSETDLPNIDGFELCQMLRSDPDMERVPFFLLSSHTDNARRMLAREVGADDYFRKPFFVSDIRALTRLFAGRRAGERAYGGDLAIVPLMNLLRTLVSGGRSGEVEILRENGRVLFKDGRIVDASVAGLQGETALERLLLLSEGPFTLSFSSVVGPGRMALTLDDLVRREQPRKRRFEHLLAKLGGLDAKLVVDYAALARELPQLPDSLNALIRLFDGRRSVGDVLRESFLDEMTTLEVLARLSKLEVLAPEEAEPASGPRPMPALFEPKKDEVEAAVEGLFPVEPPPVGGELSDGAALELRDWFSEFSAREAVEEIDGGWTELAVDEAGRELKAIDEAIPASELVRAPESLSLEEVVARDLQTPAGATPLALPGWAYAAADEAVQAVMRESGDAEEVTREALEAEHSAGSVVITGELAAAATSVEPADPLELEFLAAQARTR
ncbi:MAG: response regulator, partial [Myxococcales bacterium]